MTITILATGQKIEATVKAEKIISSINRRSEFGRPKFKTRTIKIVETDDEIQDFDGLTKLAELDGNYYLGFNKLIEV